jgi:hypothetical protein
MDERTEVHKLDELNYVERTIQTPAGAIRLGGLTVRALRKLFEKADDDDMVFYMADITDEMRGSDVLYGVIAGAGIGKAGHVCLFGPEVAGYFNSLEPGEDPIKSS